MGSVNSEIETPNGDIENQLAAARAVGPPAVIRQVAKMVLAQPKKFPEGSQVWAWAKTVLGLVPGKDAEEPEALGLPANPDCERLVLGLSLLDENYLHELRTVLAPDDLVLEKNQRIWQCIVDLYDNGRPVDTATVGVLLCGMPANWNRSVECRT